MTQLVTNDLIESLDAAKITGLLAGVVAGIPGTFLKADPDSVVFVKTGANTLSIKAGTFINVNGVAVTFPAATAVTMPSLIAGEDYAVWALQDNTLQATLDRYESPAVPPAFGARKIGGFHYSLVAPGTTVAGGEFPSSGFTDVGGNMEWTQADVDRIAGINEFSLWDLKWRCKGEQRGMALDPQVQEWLAIYFCGPAHTIYGPSRYNVPVAVGNWSSSLLPLIPVAYGGDGTTDRYGALSYYQAQEVTASHGLRLPTAALFSSATFGTVEGLPPGGSVFGPTPGTLRAPGYTSRIGIEQATSHQSVWSGDISSPLVSGGVSTLGRGERAPSSVALTLGGFRGGFGGGSRASSTYPPESNAYFISIRAAGDHLKHL